MVNFQNYARYISIPKFVYLIIIFLILLIILLSMWVQYMAMCVLCIYVQTLYISSRSYHGFVFWTTLEKSTYNVSLNSFWFLLTTASIFAGNNILIFFHELKRKTIILRNSMREIMILISFNQVQCFHYSW